jgi:lipid-binding SYLF domain-containing protein
MMRRSTKSAVKYGQLTVGRAMARPTLFLICVALLSPNMAQAQPPTQTFPGLEVSRQDATVRSSINVLNEIMAIPLSGIPTSMLSDAHGVAIIPNVIRGGFVIGARHGRGVLLIREEGAGWHAPVFITLTGGNIGWQAGVQSSDVVLVFRSRRSIDGIMSGKFTIGADASAAAGPVGRQASAATDPRLNAEILSYSRSRGLFAGVALDGSMIQIDNLATSAFYSNVGPNQQVVVPESALQLTSLVASLASTGTTVPTPQPTQSSRPPATALGSKSVDGIRSNLSHAALTMYELLDDDWRSFLAMPAEIFNQTAHPTADALRPSLTNFNVVATDAKFQTLATRPEFQSTFALLKQYSAALTETSSPVQLPPPPR